MMRNSRFVRRAGGATRLLGTLALVTVAACTSRTKDHHEVAATTHAPEADATANAPADRVEVDLFAFGAQQGYVAPCGCTTEPLGGLPFALGYIDDASGPAGRLILEPGSLLFPGKDDPEAPTDEASWAQAERRASLLHERFSAWGDALISGVGPADVRSPAGAAALRTYALPRVLTNAAPTEGFTRVLDRRVADADLAVRAYAVVAPSAQVDALPTLVDPIEALTSARAANPVDAATTRNLQAQGFPMAPGRDVVLTKNERPDWTSDKSSRRRFVAESHRVIMMLGDNLGDFVGDEYTRLENQGRNDAVDTFADHWGHDWFMIPNAIYGGWSSAAVGYQRGLSPTMELRLKLESLDDARR